MYDFCEQPWFKWNPFDYRNFWSPWWVITIVEGFQSLGYGFSTWSMHMRSIRYRPFGMPTAFWAEINDGWLTMQCTPRNYYDQHYTIVGQEEFESLLKALDAPPDPEVQKRIADMMGIEPPW